MFYYKNTEQISELETENLYKFKLPQYPQSTTDPTYYEPTATRVANMRKSAQSGKSLYDFESASDVPDISDVRTMYGRKPGVTLEEVSATATYNTLRMKEEVKAAEENEQNELKNIVKESKKAVAVSKAIKSSDALGTSETE